MYRRLFNGDHPDVAISLNNLAYLYKAQGRLGEAEPLYKEALEIYKSIYINQSINLSEQEKEKYWNTMKFYFESFHTFTNKRYTENPSIVQTDYNNLLFNKGILASSTNKMKENILGSKDDSLISIYNKWTDLKRFISKNSTLTNQELEEKHINLDSLEKLANELEKNLSLKSFAFASELNKKQYTWQDVQAKLKKDEAAVEIVRFRYHDGKGWTDTVCYAALILKPPLNPLLAKEGKTPDVEFVLLENGNMMESEYIDYYTNQIKFGAKGIIDEDSTLYNQFWQPIADKLKGIKTVYISPDGVYNNINLATLYNPKTKKYVLDEINIRLVTSTRDIIKQSEDMAGNSKQNQNAIKTAALFGFPDYEMTPDERKVIASSDAKAGFETVATDYFLSPDSTRAGFSPLPKTKIEVENLDKLLKGNGWQTKTYTGGEALEERVKALRYPRVLHIATHGKFDKNQETKYDDRLMMGETTQRFENPMLKSMLLMAGAVTTLNSNESTPYNVDDGLLTAFEAQNLYLDSTELVVLSACETGLGKVKNGEGVYGLQRAFIQAGARCLIMSLWKVPDQQTQELMVSFYTLWLSGKTKRQAFTEAQLELRKKYKTQFYWGAFVMVGE
jgi:CHAT domain-containing protein